MLPNNQVDLQGPSVRTVSQKCIQVFGYVHYCTTYQFKACGVLLCSMTPDTHFQNNRNMTSFELNTIGKTTSRLLSVCICLHRCEHGHMHTQTHTRHGYCHTNTRPTNVIHYLKNKITITPPKPIVTKLARLGSKFNHQTSSRKRKPALLSVKQVSLSSAWYQLSWRRIAGAAA